MVLKMFIILVSSPLGPRKLPSGRIGEAALELQEVLCSKTSPNPRYFEPKTLDGGSECYMISSSLMYLPLQDQKGPLFPPG